MTRDRLPPAAWLTAPATRAVIGALQASGGADCARFVGGCVRDTLLGRAGPTLDVDIATTLAPGAVTAALEAAGLRAIPTGIEHGTITAISGGRPYEITTLRRDVETDGRHAVVAFTDDWAQDAARRDFRLNALYAEPDGTIHDPVGEGLADARAGRVIFVGDPAGRIREDYLRVLRFFRFTAWYGRGAPDAAGLAACADLKAGVVGLSGERVAKELLRLLAAADPREVVRAMAASGVLTTVLPEVGGLERFDALVASDTATPVEADGLLRLAALLPDDRAAVQGVASRLRLSNAQRDRLMAALSQAEVRTEADLSQREMRRAIHRIGAAAFRDRVRLAWAAAQQAETASQWRLIHDYPDTWSPPPFPLTGDDILAAGAPKGPLVGRVRREVEAWWIERDFVDGRAAVLERLKVVVQGLAG